MFVPMRRSKQQLPADECAAILRGATAGVLGTAGTDGYPYAVPVSFAYVPSSEDDAAPDADPHVCFTVIAQSEPVPEKLTDRFCSVIAFGTARRAEGDEKAEGLWALGTKYAPGLDAVISDEIATTAHRTEVIAIDLESVTGKEGLELLRERGA